MTDEQPARIDRHRTAMVRHSLSQPVSILVRFGVLTPGVSMFDYGCGQGDDIRALAAGGIEAAGWDPHFAPGGERTSSDVVNLGFVINVIENPRERVEALRSAWSLARKALAVSAMVVGQASVQGLRPYGDGYLTSRGTFQKYYQHAELRQLIATTLGVEPIAAAPGIFLLFRAEEDADDFLLARRSVRRVSTSAFRTGRAAASLRGRQPAVEDRVAEELSAIVAFLQQRGRAPHVDELAPAVLERLAAERVSLARAIEICIGDLAPADLEVARARRREDLIVHRALAMLNRSAASPSPALMRDIRALLGSQVELASAAKDYMFGLADTERVQAAIDAAASQGLGLVDARGRLLFEAQMLNELPGPLRCYAGCATHLSGEPASDFLYRLDPARRAVSLLVMDDPDALLPTISQIVHIDLKRQDVSIRGRPRRLLRKADLLGLGPKNRQRAEERKFREEHGIDPTMIFEPLDQPM